MSMTDINIPGNPVEDYLRTDRLPHIWCPGCGLGVVVSSLLRAMPRAGLDLQNTVVVSGIGCTGRAAGYIKLDSYHATHGRALPFATGLKVSNPKLKVVVISGDGDLAAIGGNHLIHAARRNMDMTVICVNNFIYGMTGGQMGPTTPTDSRSTTSRRGNIEHPFNLPELLAACGAPYISRWTVAHVRQLELSMTEALFKKGFSFVEVISTCPTYYGRMNDQGSAIDQMRSYRFNSVVKHGANLAETDIEKEGSIIVGKFVDIEKPYLPDDGEGSYE